MLLSPPLTGTQLSPVAPLSWVLPSGHTPGNRHDRRAKPDNPRSNQPERRTALVGREMARYKVDIAALSETRFSEQGQLQETGSAIYEANRIAAAKAKRAARKSTVPRTNTVDAQALPTCPRCQRIFRARIGLVRHLRTQCTNNPTISTSTSNSANPPFPPSLLALILLLPPSKKPHPNTHRLLSPRPQPPPPLLPLSPPSTSAMETLS
ncbi:unnamed protein product [Schistocephalus solidus]|uniref:C2H2-type domain-containing protein n=1 Tax=Schistocephalus solidus TaxID=70667 RepID=A0A183SS35_SCHSO|nr:unnamed protein product [Schistocephalus solidus]